MLKATNKKIIIILLFFSCAPFLFYIDRNIIQSTVDFFISDPPNIFNIFYGWRDMNFGQNNTGVMWRLFPLGFIYYFFNTFVGVTPEITQFFILSVLFFVGSVSFSLFVSELLREYKVQTMPIVIGSMFFLFNPYILTFLPQSYFMVMPYLFLPLQLLIFIKGIKTKCFLKYSIIGGFVASIVFGVNLIFDFISFFILICLGVWYVFFDRKIKIVELIKYLILQGVFIGLFILWWIMPMLYSSLIDTATSSFNLGSENFYNNDSSVLKVLRGFGEWGFFGGHSGVLYHNFSQLYKRNAVVIFSTSLMPIIILMPILFFKKIKKRKTERKLFYFYFILIILLAFIGGTHKSWVSRSLIFWVFENIPYFKIFRNTYKWTSFLMLMYSIILVVVLNYIFVNIKKRWLSFINGGIVVMLVVVLSFPFWTGRLFESSTLIDKIPKYWLDAANYINANFNSKSSRILLLPNQYFARYDWGGESKSIPDGLAPSLIKTPLVYNTCAGCGNYYSSLIYNYIFNNFKKDNLDKMLGLVNIGKIMQRNDYDYSYYDSQSPSEIKEIISSYSSIASSSSFGELDLYNINPKLVYPRIYSPSNILLIDSLDELLDAFNDFDSSQEHNLSFILASQNKFINKSLASKANYYKKLFKSNNITFDSGIISDTFHVFSDDVYKIIKDEKFSLKTYRVYYNFSNTRCSLKFVNIDEVLSLNVDINGDNEHDALKSEVDLNVRDKRRLGIGIEGNIFSLNHTKGWEVLGDVQLAKDGVHKIDVYSISDKEKVNLINNGSFEEGFWQDEVGDCDFHDPEARIAMNLVEDASVGDFSLLLSARDDSACTHSMPIKRFAPGSVYFLSFDYKNISGSLPSFCVWDGDGCATYSDVPISNGWSNFETFVGLSNNAKQFILFLYANKDKDTVTMNLYDNIKVYSIKDVVNEVYFELPNTSESLNEVVLSDGTYKISAKVSSDANNLLKNGSFEKGFWNDKVSNCRMLDKNAPLAMKLVKNSIDNGQSIELSAEADSACVSSAIIKKFSKYKTYAVSFDYRIVKGEKAKFCVWDGVACVKSDDIKKVDNSWHRYEAVFEPNIDSKFLSVYLYASAEDVDNAIVQYDNVNINIVNNKVINAYVVRTKNKKEVEAAKIIFNKVNPTYYELSVQQKNDALIIFQESFHPGWHAYIQDDKFPVGTWQNILRYFGFWNEYKISDDKHIVANGFANAWWISQDDIGSTTEYKLILEFFPQRWFYLGLLISGTTFLGCIGYLGWGFARRRKTKKEEGLI